MKNFNIKIAALFLAFLFCFGVGINSSFAKNKKEADLKIENTENKNFENVLNTDFKMPTDEEIKAVLNQFDFSEKQKEYLLKETKKTFEEMDKTNSK